MNTTKTLSVIALALLLTACGGGKPHPVAITLESDQPEDTALDSSKQSLQLRHMSGEHTLEQRPGDNPATYENGQIAFYSDGQTAVLARPASATVLLTGCRP